MNAAEIAKALDGRELSTGGWSAKCPAHEDKSPSLSIAEGTKGPVFHCHAGCDQDAVIGKLKDRGLWNGADRSAAPDEHPTLGPPSVSYDYHDAVGRHVGRVMRFDRPDGKEIRQCSLHGSEWIWKAMPEPRPLYRLPQLLACTSTVLMVEGEKAVAAAIKIATDLEVTTWAGGAKAASKTDLAPLKKRNVILWPDNDQPGRDAMNAIARRLQGVAALVRLFEPATLGELPDGWDAADAFSDRDCDLQALYDALTNAPVMEDRPNDDTTDTSVSKSDSAPDDPLSDFRAAILADLSAGADAIDAAAPPSFVVYPHMPVCGANLAAGGGTGKTTNVINESIAIVAGGDLYGAPIDKQGKCVIVTAEDGAGYVRYLQQRVLADGFSLGLFPENVVRCAKANMPVIGWPRAKYGPLVYADQFGNFHRAAVFDLLLELLRSIDPVYVTLDPSVLFSAGERYVNDGDAFFASMIHEAALGLGCCFQVIDHVSQNVARTQIVDQYAARGGTAKSDNARMARQLVVYRQDDSQKPERVALPFAVTPEDITKGRLMQLHWTKLNYAPRPDPVWLLRRGYVIEGKRAPSADMRQQAGEQARERLAAEDVEVIVAHVANRLAIGRGIRLSQNDLEKERIALPDGNDMPRTRLRAAVQHALATGRLTHHELPADERQGRRKQFLAPP